jgi:hypothetical protein
METPTTILLVAMYLKEHGYTVHNSSTYREINVYYKYKLLAKVYSHFGDDLKIAILTGKRLHGNRLPPTLEVDIYDPYSLQKILRHIRNRGYLAFLEDGRKH